MSHRLAIALAVAMVLVVVPPTGVVAGEDPGPHVGQRLFVLAMRGASFNGFSYPDSPLLEAYAGEDLTFVVHVPAELAEPHTFHLHGHPWPSEDPGRFIDTVLLKQGETHTFRVMAGTNEGHAGDWLYHCHMDLHFQLGMYGILRVYPFSIDVDGPRDALDLRVHRMSVPLEDATFTAELDGQPVDVDAVDLGDGRYQARPQLPTSATGELVVSAHHEIGTSLARLELSPGSGYELVRDVRPAQMPPAVQEALDPLQPQGAANALDPLTG